MEGMTYLGSLFHDASFEIHHFKNEKEQMHAIWARDDKSLNPENFYHIEDIYSAKIFDSHGDIIDRNEFKITDTPIYLVWRSMDPITFIDTPKALDLNVTNIMALSWKSWGPIHYLLRVFNIDAAYSSFNASWMQIV